MMMLTPPSPPPHCLRLRPSALFAKAVVGETSETSSEEEGGPSFTLSSDPVREDSQSRPDEAIAGERASHESNAQLALIYYCLISICNKE